MQNEARDILVSFIETVSGLDNDEHQGLGLIPGTELAVSISREYSWIRCRKNSTNRGSGTCDHGPFRIFGLTLFVMYGDVKEIRTCSLILHNIPIESVSKAVHKVAQLHLGYTLSEPSHFGHPTPE